jgi:hypothetical protein
VFEQVDLLVTPTTPGMPEKIVAAEAPTTASGAESSVGTGTSGGRRSVEPARVEYAPRSRALRHRRRARYLRRRYIRLKFS